ncbi:MAG: chorismate pyruvate-lyase family protein [Promethearchaeota archaeon]
MGIEETKPEPGNHHASTNASVKSAIEDIENLLMPHLVHEGELNFEETNQSLHELGKRNHVRMNLLKRILLTTNGSVTRILQSSQKNASQKVRIKTINQVIVGKKDGVNDNVIFNCLNIPPSSSFNFRKVVLTTERMNYILAISLLPLCRLNDKFQDDLMRADEPIGLLLDKYKIEMLRRIVFMGKLAPTREMQEIFNIGRDRKVTFRMYDIIHDGKILMRIFEFLNPKI